MIYTIALILSGAAIGFGLRHVMQAGLDVHDLERVVNKHHVEIRILGERIDRIEQQHQHRRSA